MITQCSHIPFLEGQSREKQMTKYTRHEESWVSMIKSASTFIFRGSNSHRDQGKHLGLSTTAFYQPLSPPHRFLSLSLTHTLIPSLSPSLSLPLSLSQIDYFNNQII